MQKDSGRTFIHANLAFYDRDSGANQPLADPEDGALHRNNGISCCDLEVTVTLLGGFDNHVATRKANDLPAP